MVEAADMESGSGKAAQDALGKPIEFKQCLVCQTFVQRLASTRPTTRPSGEWLCVGRIGGKHNALAEDAEVPRGPHRCL